MPSLRDIRRRIRSVGNIQQITRAMEMVATTKLRRVQARAQALRPFTLEMQSMVTRLVAIAPPESSPFVRPAPAAGAPPEAAAPPIGLLVVTSDRGLCGAHNTNVLATVHRFLRERGLETATSRGPDLKGKVALYVVGRKGYSYFTRRGYDVAHYIADPVLEKMTFRDIVVMAKGGARDFLAGKVSEISIVSTRFESMVSFKPEVNPWLPIRPPEAKPNAKEGSNTKEAGEKYESIDAIVQPSVPALLETLLPKYLAVRLANLMLEALTSEFASRRVSMKNATDAADDLRKGLQRVYNRARQESITKQLLEIVGGAEALR